MNCCALLNSAFVLACLLSDPVVEGRSDNQAQLPQSGILLCGEPEYDFGGVKAGEVIAHEFEVRNLGRRDVWIKVIPAAACLCSRYFEIKAGASVRIPVRLDTRRYNGRVNKAYKVVLSPPPA